jgi:DNA-binding NtrC family response regulator
MKLFRILMIDEDPWIGFALHNLIGKAYSIEVAAPRNVDALETQLSVLPFDFVFLDVTVTGEDTYRIIKHLTEREIPYALTSATALAHHLPQMLRSAPFLFKPLQFDQVKAVLSIVRQ